MEDGSIKAIVAEIAPLLIGRAPGKIFQLDQLSLTIDFRIRDGYVFISVEPGLPRLYLIKRRVRDLEKQSIPLTQFALTVRKELANTTLKSLENDFEDRVVRFRFAGKDESEQPRGRTLVAQLTGRSANLFLLDARGAISHQLRDARVLGQNIGDRYQPPKRRTIPAIKDGPAEQGDSLSESLDRHYEVLLNQRAFDAKASSIRAHLKRELTRAGKLLKKLQDDLVTHADAEQQKRLGDLLLANLSTAKRIRNRVKLIDYFSADAPVIEIEVDEELTLPQEAERRFALYSRSKRAVSQINSRIVVARPKLATLEAQRAELKRLVAERDETALEHFVSRSAVAGLPRELSLSISRAGLKRKPEKKIPGVRRYVSSDGFEILVGRTSRDNDHLTFKVARPSDLWLHVADYGGSHVVVRNPTRKEIPHRTLIEAAQLAAKFSQARKDPKVDVHYSERKFVSKVKGAKPGLVRLARFKNITVAPKECVERIA
jgi:predicted ribosome quality control (RQC) complex YloA/Tae2 family protein